MMKHVNRSIKDTLWIYGKYLCLTTFTDLMSVNFHEETLWDIKLEQNSMSRIRFIHALKSGESCGRVVKIKITPFRTFGK